LHVKLQVDRLDRIADAALVNSALKMAASSLPTTKETIIHADHGARFSSWAFTSNVRDYGRKLSLGTIGDCYGNAMMESSWGRMQKRTSQPQSVNLGPPFLNSAWQWQWQWQWPITLKIRAIPAGATHHGLCSHQSNTKQSTQTTCNYREPDPQTGVISPEPSNGVLP